MTTETRARQESRAVRTLRTALVGDVLVAGDEGYDSARRLWNAAFDKRPALVVRPLDVTEVVTAVRVARDHGLEIGVRCGGHGALGLAVPDGGLLIDLRSMRRVRVDPHRRRALVQGGALLGALDRAAQEHGLATTAGNVSHTGVGGLTLGGGMGWLARRLGLSCDNVVSYEVVTATGEVVRASALEHPDLFWGLRGGGGNFGVVTDFEFQLHETGTDALVVELDLPLTAEVLRGWREQSDQAPRAATYTANLYDGWLTVGYVWVGSPDRGRELLPALRALGPGGDERVLDLSYLQLQSRGDQDLGGAPDVRRYAGGHYFHQLTDETIDAVVAGALAPGAPSTSLQAYGGAIADVTDADSAFSHRGTAFELVAGTGWRDPHEDDWRIASAQAYVAALTPYASGAYVNRAVGTDGLDRLYGRGKQARLVAVKDVYDPENVFHLNQNIVPSRSR